MALRVADATGTEATLWMDLQTQYDLWQARPKEEGEDSPFPAKLLWRNAAVPREY